MIDCHSSPAGDRAASCPLRFRPLSVMLGARAPRGRETVPTYRNRHSGCHGLVTHLSVAEASGRMTRVPVKVPLSYVVLARGGWSGLASVVHEPHPAVPPYRSSSGAPDRPAASATPPRRPPGSSAPRVRLHLSPGQRGTK